MKNGYRKSIRISLLIALCIFAVGVLPENCKTVRADATANNSTVTLNQDSKKVYELSTPEQLLAFSYLVSGSWAGQTYFQTLLLDGVTYNLANNAPDAQMGADASLTADIDLSGIANWTPISGTVEDGSTNYYQGCFDGQGHTVSNLNIQASTGWQGLFGGVSGSIKNVKVEGTLNSTFAQGMIGGICGYLSGGTVDNCQSSCSLQGIANIGGVVGYNKGGVVKNCITTASNSVIGTSVHVGGVVGYNMTGATTTKCTNNGTVELRNSSDTSSFAGGVVGRNYNGSTISYCINNGNVSQTVGTGAVGGIVGNNTTVIGTDQTAGNATYVLYCTNYGTITNVKGKAGSIIGKNQLNAYYFGNKNYGTATAHWSWEQVGNDEFTIVAFMNNTSAEDDTYSLVGYTTTTDSCAFVMPADPVRKGYNFEGWYTTRDGNDKMPEATAEIPLGAVYYAKWKAAAEGTVSIVVKNSKNLPELNVKTTKETLMSLLLTSEEQSKIKAGKNAVVSFAINEVLKKEKFSIKKVLNEKYGKNHYAVLICFSLDLSKTIEENETVFMTSTGKNITLQFTIPNTILNKRNTEKYQLVRLDNGKATEVKDLDKNKNTITGKVKNLTTYAIVYLK